MFRGYTQLYTGNGKGKTTAAIGLALRAAGAGMNVFIGQFAKGRSCSELEALKRFADCITVRQFGTQEFIRGIIPEDAMICAEKGMAEVRRVLSGGAHDVVILDEGALAVDLGLVSLSALLDLITKKPEHVELVITGRNAPPELIDAADLVTEMKEIKHYYHTGVHARTGIEM